METVWAVMRTEIRLTWRRSTFWVVLGIWLLPLALTFVSNLPNAGTLSGGAYVSEQLVTALTTWLVLLPLIVGPSLIRDLGEAGELLWTTPLDAMAHLLGVALGLLVALTPLLVAQLAAQALVGYALVGAPASLFWHYGPPLLLASTVMGVSVAVVLALLFRRMLVLLLGWVALWAGAMQVSMGLLGGMESGALASPANIFFHTLELSPTLGLGLARPLVGGLAVWFVGLGVLVAVVGVAVALRIDQRRGLRDARWLLTAIVVAGVLASGGRLLHVHAVRAQSIPTSPPNIQAGRWQVEAHALDVTVDAVRETLAGRSMVRLLPLQPASEAEVVLRLNHGLALIAVQSEAGEQLTWERVGDSVVVALPKPVEGALTLHLQWQGRLHLPARDYVAQTPAQSPAFDTPEPVQVLLGDGVGYLFRDGNWYPWPWEEGAAPKQAAESQVTVRVVGRMALASAPVRDGVVRWEGELPAVLLVLPPQGSKVVGDRTLYFGQWVSEGSVLMRRLEQMATLLPAFAATVGEHRVPTHIVALPYLNDLVWSEDFLLVPEGTGALSDERRRLLVASSLASEMGVGPELRAVTLALAHAWLANHLVLPSGWARVRPDGKGIVALIGGAAEMGTVNLPGVSDDVDGRWVRFYGTAQDVLLAPDAGTGPDLRTMVKTQLGPQDHLDLLALWLAVEQADPTVREADLAVLLAPPDPSPNSTKFEPFLMRSLPFDFPVGQAEKRAFFAALHSWLEEVGRARGLALVGEVIRAQEGEFDLGQLLGVLRDRSGVAISYEEGK